MIDVCISVNAYNEKQPRDKIKDIRFQHKKMSVENFYGMVLDGYAYTSVMKDGWRCKDNFICTSIITYDIDHSEVPMGEYYNDLAIKPTFTYTTSSNGLDGYSFRLVYILDKEICSNDKYYLFSRSLAEQIDLASIDNRSFLGEQFWFGNSSAETIFNGNILSQDSIVINENYATRDSSNSILTKSDSQSIIYTQQHYTLSGTFLQDFKTLSLQEIVDKYNSTYENKQRSDVELNEEEPIIYYQDDYYEIKRPFKPTNGYVVKFKDGDNRRRKLFLNGIIRRNIKPDITYENILFNLIWELVNYYINDGNKILKRELLEIAENVMNADMDNYKGYGRPTNKFFVNPLFCKIHNMTKKQVLGCIRNKKQFIGEFYDPSLTDKRNIEVMKEYGLDISIRTLKRWKKENGISKRLKC